MALQVKLRGTSKQYDLATATGGAAIGEWIEVGGDFSASVFGAFNATIIIEMSFDQGATAIPLTEADGSTKWFTIPERIDIEELEGGVYYRFRCIAWVSGTATCRMGR